MAANIRRWQAKHAEMQHMEFGIGARLRAARHLAGFTNVEDLATAMDQDGFSAKTLRAIETERRTATPAELNEIAHFCGLPLAWFTADFSRLDEISDDPRKRIAAQLAAAVERAREKRAEQPANIPPLQEEGQ